MSPNKVIVKQKKKKIRIVGSEGKTMPQEVDEGQDCQDLYRF